jgi:hypothetical protein
MGPKKRKKRNKYKMSRIKTRLLKKDVPKDLLPLFNHMIKLAADSHKRGYTKRAGIELRKARRLAGER